MTVYVITRHPALLQWLRKHRPTLAEQAVPVSHIGEWFFSELKEGDIVVGVVPVPLVAAICKRGARYFHMCMHVPYKWRGKELTLAQMEEFGARLEGYNVTPV